MRGRTRRGAGSIGLCWVLAVAAAGCTEAAADPPPEPPPATAETSPSPTPTPTPTPVAPETVKPERPEAMATVDVDGAVAVARYFLALYPYVYATGDLEEWRALSHPECVFCASVVTNVESNAAAGSVTEGGLMSITSLSAMEIDPGLWYSAVGSLTEGPGTVRDAAGVVVDQRPASSDYDVTFALIYEGAKWQVRELDVVPSGPKP